MHELVIKNGLCMIVDEFIGCNVGIDGEKITYIGRQDIQGDVMLDASNHLVLPGMFNSHTHAAMTLFRGYAEGLPLKSWLERIWKLESMLNAEDVYWGTMLACIEMLKTGTTCFADMYIFMDMVAKAVAEVGIRAVLGYGMADRGDDAKARQELDIGVRFIREWNNTYNGRIRCMITPHSVYTCTPDFLRVLTKQPYNVVKHIHVAETRWEIEEVRKNYGKTPVQLLDEIGFLDSKTVIAHGVWLSEEDMRILKDRGVSVAHCPSSNLKLSSGIAPVKEMLEKGINVCIGTDGAASNNMLNMFLETRLAALLQLYRGCNDVTGFIRLSTINGYRAYGMEGGELKTGNLADIILVEKKPWHFPSYNPTNSILFASTGMEVTHTIVGGEIVVESGEVVTVDEDRVLRKVEARSEKFRAK